MKILFVSHDDGKYGAARSLIKMITIQKEKFNIIPIVITRKFNEINKFCNENNIENYVLPYFNCITYNFNNKNKLAFFKLIQNVKKNIGNFLSINILKNKIDIKSVDIIHTNISTIDFGATVAKKYSIPHFWHIREFGEDDINGCPVSSKYYDLMNKSNKIIAISDTIRNYWINKGVDSNIIKTIYNGIELEEFTYKMNNFNSKEIKIIFSGSAAVHKGVSQVIDAIEILKCRGVNNISVDIYGDYSNSYGTNIQKEVNKKKLQKIIKFKGFCSNIKRVMCNYDIGLVCSKAEAFGRVTVEYMLSGNVVIASDTGANSEIIENEKNGLLYEYGNPIDLANKIEYLIKNRRIISKYTKNAYEKATNDFTATNNAISVYSEFINNI